MIGWSRRNTESSRRRQAWWDSLTDEQKALETRREKEGDRWFFSIVGCMLVYMIGLFFLLPREWANRHETIAIGLCLLGHPGGMIIGAFVTIYKQRQVK